MARRLARMLTVEDVAERRLGDRGPAAVEQIIELTRSGNLPAHIAIGSDRPANWRWRPDSFALWECIETGRPYLLTVHDAADRTGKKPKTLHAMYRYRRMPSPLALGEKGPGGRRGAQAIRWLPDELDAWIETGQRECEWWGPILMTARQTYRFLGFGDPDDDGVVEGGPLIASAGQGAMKYHREGCKQAKPVKKKNRVTFATPQEAEAAGFIPCRHCCKSCEAPIERIEQALGVLVQRRIIGATVETPSPPGKLSKGGFRGDDLDDAQRNYYLRHDLEARFRERVRPGRRLLSEWHEATLLCQADIAGIIATAKHRIHALRNSGAFLEPHVDLASPDATSPSSPKRWRRDRIEQWLTESERVAADEQATAGGFVAPAALAVAFQISETELAALDIPIGEGGYRVDLVQDWLAERREEIREDDERLAPIALLTAKHAAFTLGVTAPTVNDWAGDLESGIVTLELPVTGYGRATDRLGRRLRLRSLRQRFGVATGAPIPDERVGEHDLAVALDGSPTTKRWLNRYEEHRRREFLATGAVVKKDASDRQGVHTFTYMDADGNEVTGKGATRLSATEKMMARAQEREWKRLRQRPEQFLQAEGNGRERSFGIPNVDLWLRALEGTAPQDQQADHPSETPVAALPQQWRTEASATAAAPRVPAEPVLALRRYFWLLISEKERRKPSQKWRIGNVMLESVQKNRKKAPYNLTDDKIWDHGGKWKAAQWLLSDIEAAVPPPDDKRGVLDELRREFAARKR